MPSFFSCPIRPVPLSMHSDFLSSARFVVGPQELGLDLGNADISCSIWSRAGDYAGPGCGSRRPDLRGRRPARIAGSRVRDVTDDQLEVGSSGAHS